MNSGWLATAIGPRYVGRIERTSTAFDPSRRADRNHIPIARPVGAHTRHERRRMKELTGLANVHVLDLHRQQVEPGQRGRNGLDGKVARCHELMRLASPIHRRHHSAGMRLRSNPRVEYHIEVCSYDEPPQTTRHGW